MKKILEIIRKKWLRKTTLTLLLVGIVIAIYLVINFGVQYFELSDIDLTEEGYYSISEETKNQLEKIDEEIIIYIFGYEEDSTVVDLAKRYSKIKENIKVELVSVTENPDIATSFGITSSDEQSGILVFSCEGRNVKVGYYDLYTYDYNTYEYVDLTEQKITNSILAVTLEESPKVYFLTGHGEYTIDVYMTVLKSALESEVNQVESLDILVKNEIPSDCDTLVIATPETDLTDFETEQIINYINNGGNLLWLSDYTNNELANVNKILDLYGLSLKTDGVIFEQDSSAMLREYQVLIIPTANESAEITSEISNSGKVLFGNSCKIDVKSEEELDALGVSVTELLKTSDKAFYRTNLDISSSSPADGEEVKSYTVGVLASKNITKEDETTVTSEIVVYANNFFATDYPLTVTGKAASAIYFYNNQDLILNSISYLTDREDTITIRKTYSYVSYEPTAREDLVVKVIIFTVPLFIIVVGIVVWRKRKLRK